MHDRSYRQLTVWRKSVDLACRAYELAKAFPKEEQYRLTSQLVRAAASVPANIAEGYMRGTRKDYAHFISIARGSCAEVETFLIIAGRCGFAPQAEIGKVLDMAEEVGRMLTSLRRKLEQPRPPTLDPRP